MPEMSPVKRKALESSARAWEAILAELHPGHKFTVHIITEEESDQTAERPERGLETEARGSVYRAI